MGCLIAIVLFAMFEFADWCIAQFGVWAASKAFGFETNIWMVVVVFLVLQVLAALLKGATSKRSE